MSIIYEALQKTQATRDIPLSKETETPGKVGMRIWNKILMSILFVLIVTTLSTFFIFAYHVKKPHARIAKAPVAVKPVTPIGPRALPQLTLNGLFLSDDEVMAMINNRVVHVGDIIENMKVVSITDEGVELQNDQRRLMLKESIIKSS